MKVTVEKPQVITLLYRQEKEDPDYGSCLWARFYLDLKNYTMAIESDCGNYTHGWVPTPNSESFIHLLARMNEDYLLGKIANETDIDFEATAEKMVEIVKEFADGEGIELREWDIEQISDACYHHDSVRDVVDAVLNAVISSQLRDALEQETYDLYCAVVMDYPAGAKKIASVFINYIQPELKYGGVIAE